MINLKPFNKLAVIIKVKFLTLNPMININFRTKSVWGKICLKSYGAGKLVGPTEFFRAGAQRCVCLKKLLQIILIPYHFFFCFAILNFMEFL